MFSSSFSCFFLHEKHEKEVGFYWCRSIRRSQSRGSKQWMVLSNYHMLACHIKLIKWWSPASHLHPASWLLLQLPCTTNSAPSPLSQHSAAADESTASRHTCFRQANNRRLLQPLISKTRVARIKEVMNRNMRRLFLDWCIIHGPMLRRTSEASCARATLL